MKSQAALGGKKLKQKPKNYQFIEVALPVGGCYPIV